MTDISFEINGKKVSPHNMDNALESTLLQSVQTSISRAVGSTLCPQHGQKPTIQVKGRKLDTLSFEVSGCCDQLIEIAKKKLQRDVKC